MKLYSLMGYLWLIFLVISACGPVSIPTQTAATIEPQPTLAEKYHSLDNRTGIAEIDNVLAAVESDDPQSIRDLFRYTRTTCMTVNALGGPPPCREGEAEGTPVEVLPFLGPEGSYLRNDEISNWPGLEVAGLYAVYRVSEKAYSDQYFPKGDYGVILVGKGRDENVVLQIKNGGIVRIDYVFDTSQSALTGILERSVAELILAPIE